MSEAIIAKHARINITYKYETVYNNRYNYIYQDVFDPPLTAFIPISTTYTVPENLVGNSVMVALYGAKGSDNSTASGQGGEIVVENVNVTPGENIPVYVGNSGVNGSSGEPTSFGNYLIANGGKSANSLTSTDITDVPINNNDGYAIIWYNAIGSEG